MTQSTLKALPLWLKAAIVLAVAVIGASFAIEPHQAWMNFVVCGYYLLQLGLFGSVFVAIFSLTGSSWWVPLKPVPEAMARTLVPFAVVWCLVLLGGHSIWEWMQPGFVANDEILSKKAAWLNTSGFTIRFFIYLAIWLFFSRPLLKNEQSLQLKKPAAIFLVVFGLSWCVSSFDWIMSLEPHWFSTIFGIYTFAGLLVSGFAALILLVLGGRSIGLLPKVNENHLHDLGKLLFGFCTFLAYIWFCQYMLIWYANIPEETSYYVARLNGSWATLFYGSFILSWVVPFLLLLPRNSKRNPKVLGSVAGIVLVAHWFDNYLLVAPSFHLDKEAGVPVLGLMELFFGLSFAVLGASVLWMSLNCKKHRHEPATDALFEEGAHLVQ